MDWIRIRIDPDQDWILIRIGSGSGLHPEQDWIRIRIRVLPGMDPCQSWIRVDPVFGQLDSDQGRVQMRVGS